MARSGSTQRSGGFALLVEQDEEIARFYVFALRRVGFEVLHIKEATGVLGAHTPSRAPNLIIADEDCAQALAILGQAYPHARRVLMVTTHEHEVDPAARALVDALLQLPFTRAQLERAAFGAAAPELGEPSESHLGEPTRRAPNRQAFDTSERSTLPSTGDAGRHRSIKIAKPSQRRHDFDD